MTVLSEYQGKYEHATLERDQRGVLRVTLHTNGGPLVYGRHVHSEWLTLWNDIGRDDENRLVVITGAADAFIPARPMPGGSKRHESYSPQGFHRFWRESVVHITDLLAIPMPVIAAVNGPARIHCEIALLSDMVIATPDAVFQDLPHFPEQVVPGDGMHVLMPLLLGRIRGGYFLYRGEIIDAARAESLGLVNEIVERPALLDRADELADELLRQPDHNLRYLRMLLTHDLKKRMQEMLGLGMAVEGLASLSNDWSNWVSPNA
jgi:enoyl-CoA hydratase/carnithine racemase